MKLKDANVKARFQYVLDGGYLTRADLKHLNICMDEIHMLMGASLNINRLIELDDELHDIQIILNVSMANHPDNEWDLYNETK